MAELTIILFFLLKELTLYSIIIIGIISRKFLAFFAVSTVGFVKGSDCVMALNAIFAKFLLQGGGKNETFF